MKPLMLVTLCCLAAVAPADTIELVSGDRITGRVISQSPAEVVVDHPDMGRLTLNAEKVKAVHQDADKPAPTPAAPAAAAPLPQPPAIERPVKAPNFVERLLVDWDSKLEFGLHGDGGDTDRQDIYVRLATRSEKDRDRWVANGRYSLGRAAGETTMQQADATITRDWLQKDSPWFLFARGNYRFDEFQSWLHRTSGYGGGGVALVDNDTVKVTSRAGVGGTYEFGRVNEWTSESLFSGAATDWKVTKRLTFSGELTYYPNIELFSDYRLQASASLIYKLDLLDGLSLKVGIDDEYNSMPDNRDDHHNFKYYSAIVVEF